MFDFNLSRIIHKGNRRRRSPIRSQSSKLVFVGGIFSESKDLNPIRDIELTANSVWLNTAQVKDWVEITRMHLDKNTYSYLCNLGLKPGIVAEIISKTVTGSIIIRINQQQIGLGAEIACKLVVKLVARQNNES